MSEINPYSNDKEYPKFDISTSEIEDKINIENFKPNDPNEMLQSDLENSYINEIHEESSEKKDLLNDISDQPLAYEKNDNSCSSNWSDSKEILNILDNSPEYLGETTPNLFEDNVPEPNDKDNNYKEIIKDIQKVPEMIEDNDANKNIFHEVPSKNDEFNEVPSKNDEFNEVPSNIDNEIPINEDNNTDTDSEFKEEEIEKPKRLCPIRLTFIILLLIFIIVMSYY